MKKWVFLTSPKETTFLSSQKTSQKVSENISQKIPKKSIILLGLIWGVVTAFNLTKAFHIDDTAYLEVSNWLLHSPLHPMHGRVNWGIAHEPISHLTMPHFFFYFLAPWIALFGTTEIAVHSLVALFSLGCVVLFYKIARNRLSEDRALYLTALMAISPSFLPSQNVMLEIPLLCFIFLSVFGFLKLENRTKRHLGRATSSLWAGLPLSCLVLIKYTALVFLPVFFLSLKRRDKWVILLPIGTLVVWSLFNYWDYGGIHLFQHGPPLTWRAPLLRMLDWFACLGAMVPFTLLLAGEDEQKKGQSQNGRRRTVFIFCIALAVHLVFKIHRTSAQSWMYSSVGALLAMNGAYLVLRLVTSFRIELIKDRYTTLLYLWFFGVFCFISLFSPFMAARHVLLAIPALLLIASLKESFWSHSFKLGLSFFMTLSVAVVVGVSDRNFADIHRQAAAKVSKQFRSDQRSLNAKIYFIGHWGWQWYARQNGMIQYEPGETALKQGDILIAPSFASNEGLTSSDLVRLVQEEKIEIPSTPWDWFRTISSDPHGNFYSSSLNEFPIQFSTKPLQTYTVFRVH